MQHAVAAVIPVLDDGPALDALLDRIAAHLAEVVVVDGGSRDGARDVARRFSAVVLETTANRGAQLDAGWRATSAPWLWFLHADSTVSRPAIEALDAFVRRDVPRWGRFDVAVRDPDPVQDPAHAGVRGRAPVAAWQRVLSSLMNQRSMLTGICTGDQGIVVHRRLLEAVGGVPRQPLMEDVELSRRLRRLARVRRIPARLGTDARRWRRYGVVPTILSMWSFRLRYWGGADPAELARRYYRSPDRPPDRPPERPPDRPSHRPSDRAPDLR